MKKSQLLLAASILSFLVFPPTSQAAPPKAAAEPADGIAFVDAATNNGDFEEEGELKPWAGDYIYQGSEDGKATYPDNTIKVVKDPAFASHGSSYVSIQQNGGTERQQMGVRLLLGQLKGPNGGANIDLEDGRTFTLSYDARNGETGFAFPHAEMVCATPDGAVVLTGETLASDPLSSEEWRTYRLKFLVPDNVNDLNHLEIRIALVMPNPQPEAIYQGFIDNVTLIQSK